MFNEPVIVSPVFNTLSDAEPVKFAVIVPAEKLPDESRCTAYSGVLELENCILPAFQTTWFLIVNPSEFTTSTLREPDPADALPPDASILAL